MEHFRVNSLPPISPRFNIAPTQQVGVVRQDPSGQREFVWMHWGLVPHWAKDPKIGSQMINARSESAATKPAFRDSFRRRRCLIVADGFYEWKKEGRKKQPYHIRMKDGSPLAFAGLWDRWGSEPNRLESCTILTTSAIELLADLHERMPVILDPAEYEAWLATAEADAPALQPMLDACPADALEVAAANPRANSVANDDPDVLSPPRLLFE
jgi:putative SOS response-associated peptidase YedK